MSSYCDFEEQLSIVDGDGRGRRLGRTFGVKLWPTLVFLRDGEEIAKLVRPKDAAEVMRAFTLVDAG